MSKNVCLVANGVDPDLMQHVASGLSLHCLLTVCVKTAGYLDKTGRLSFCPAKYFSLSDRCPVKLGQKEELFS